MNFHTFNSDYVEPSQSYPSDRFNPSAASPPPPTSSQVTIVRDPSSDLHSAPEPSIDSELPPPSSYPTAIPHAPTPPGADSLSSTPSELEIYGPDRYAGRQLGRPDNTSSLQLTPVPASHFNILMAAPPDPVMARDFKDELARAASVVTPGVDDSPYIRYAIEALTRQRDDGRGISENSSPGEANIPRQHIVPLPSHVVNRAPVARQHLEPAAEISQRPATARSPEGPQQDGDKRESWKITDSMTSDELLHARRRRREEIRKLFPDAPPFAEWEGMDFDVDDLPPVEMYRPQGRTDRNPPRNIDVWQALPDNGDVEKAHPFFTPLTYKPWILRSGSLLLLITLCVLMIAALIFCAIYSVGRNGFTAYHSNYGGQYFLFRMLPQLLGAILVIYGQCVLAAAFRILPFSAMASEDRSQRRNAVFLPLYVKSFLWPQLVGDWSIWIPSFNIWLMSITIPLQSSVFTVVMVDGIWTWSTVQGVAWTLVALYVSLVLSLIVMFVYWRQRRTGMMNGWDIRTLADVIFLVSQSNSLPQYRGLETAETREQIRLALDGTAEKLGFWTTPEVPENPTFYGIGVPTTDEDLEIEKLDRKDWADQRTRPVTPPDAAGPPDRVDVRSRYLPWCFRDSQIIFFVVAASILLVALVVVSFLHSTDVRQGFLPGLSAAPVTGAFSPADFLYSFIPSLIGLLLWLMFQSLDITLRILAPWGELSRPEGSRAETSLLLDYAACLPWESTYKAIKHKHWRVAFITFLSPLLVLLPVLGGGLFMALTPPSGIVRMFPNNPTFAIILTLLVLYLLALVSLIPSRQKFRLSHAVTCLAEIISFCCNEQLRTDPAFDFEQIYSHKTLRGHLDCGVDWHRQGRWTFGAGRNRDERLGIKRYSKFTVNPKKLRQYDKRARGQLISIPLPRGSGSLYGN
ncbi:hypothetical protein F5X99DRAFT_170030 [Biscogniauxia marginata]|nr:hypothetical protein F5X99DRAFT_170030 [Biscogniauxia marginata]